MSQNTAIAIIIFGTAFLAVYGYSEYQMRTKGYVDKERGRQVWWGVISVFLIGLIVRIIYLAQLAAISK